MSKFCVSADPNSLHQIIHIDRSDEDATALSLVDLSLAPGYAGALATDGRPHQVVYFNWSSGSGKVPRQSAHKQQLGPLNDDIFTTGFESSTQFAERPIADSLKSAERVMKTRLSE
ncbi:MAG: hypothetical protein KZQ66_09265 [Candidatus Thiodiazotropha sp. (ex Lucinoma aequizonata)]|nr:hypothetical protein [Candidatus Thiodiazotropha sp. (ex Lucinoma aequizonata)]MCU7888960.1 hypothetical protein [Candidatus Thiodiazotropha sp. (ex Lucinoma aequizonata)]MCU7896055.1 hypothetical protein [Candidatus Thiodiazotropha sp. (ex Lucinoma aequizonata)]MCU7899898.1 hypothetical protein [Candidatus Thiodiazotropha sp. (ex Lucinoma aequizonata)]MCU7902159.1 hypothetical protein [Candidatus Thiodiazotropha sp. (ex Lucinoma aequizonata)]